MADYEWWELPLIAVVVSVVFAVLDAIKAKWVAYLDRRNQPAYRKDNADG